ncbi:MAG: hypothetical protein KDJ52_07030 [Anaerolineae bacterium]|nr:hypothetical protein [Anaerolineae bacterium]
MMKNFGDLQTVYLLIGLALSAVVALVFAAPTYAGDPDDTIGPANPNVLVCRRKSDGKYVNLENDAFPGTSGGTIEFDPDEEVNVSKLERECDREGGELEYAAATEIIGYVYEYFPSSDDPDEWYAVPRAGIPVIAEGIDFEIFWISEDNGYYYFYKTRFGSGPILLNLQLPPDATAINPNIRIESTGFSDTWTVYLGFYRGDIEPPDIENLHTPDGEPLPRGDTRFYDNVGLDGKTALPAVGGIKEEQQSMPVMALAAAIAIVLPVIGVITIRRNRQSNKTDDRIK